MVSLMWRAVAKIFCETVFPGGFLFLQHAHTSNQAQILLRDNVPELLTKEELLSLATYHNPMDFYVWFVM